MVLVLLKLRLIPKFSLAGITTKEATNSEVRSSILHLRTSSSSAPTTTTNTVDSQLSVPIQTQTLNTEPTTINLQPITIQPIEPTLPTQPTQPDPVATIYVVTVQLVNGANKFLIDGQVAPQLNFVYGNIYIFDQSDASNSGHQIQITELPEPGNPVSYSTTTSRPGERDSSYCYQPQNANKVLYYLCQPHDKYKSNNVSDTATIQPIVDPTPPGVSPVVDSDDEENTLPVTTLQTQQQ